MMPAFSKTFRLTIIIHLLIMLGLLLLLLQPLKWDVNLPTEYWVRQSVLFCLWVILFYVNSGILVPKLLFKNKPALFVLSITSSVILIILIIYLLEIWLTLPNLMHKAFRPNDPIKPGFHLPRFDIVMLLTTILVIGVSTIITLIQKWRKDADIRYVLEQEKIRSELSFLKAQINPHFFFNTLHSIYALTTINVDKAREALYTLSHMMRYVLYDTESGLTLLSKEIGFIQDYIKLTRLRLTDNVKITFDHPEKLKEVSIAPMLLLPFVENAFKHGVSTLQTSNIKISINQKENGLDVEISNSVFKEKRSVLEESSGIGLVNTRRRLELLYSNQYELTVNQTENEYRVILNLQLL